MKIISNPLVLKQHLKDIDKTAGFVPTMGALHEGHIALIKHAKEENEVVVVSIFVNPTQFLAGEDLDKYPTKDEADKKICELAGVDILFFPNAQEIYSQDEVKICAPNVRGYVLEGATRPGHFSGVLRVVMKLLNIVSPTRAYFGKKDAQQLNLISLMVKQFFMSVEIVPVDIVRDSDGLALSSRNVYLSKEQRKEALKIPKSLYAASKLISKNILNTEKIKEEIYAILAPLETEYVEVLSRDFEVIDEVQIGNSIILVEVIVGETRLLDNIWL
ncbi:pantoate--beta-alanine ligase [Sulfurimonas autotrophica]|uniref:Pantothenate synthetase n=1 Tax=Sulfurimonas autotrophica (strain ATCC BAA-671 / DSM 16294 / JCM 11897 / OK10) TaxID=563040 RepID=E0UUE0_SULAO|nr:pantoate--beta-alanine ligase [Sulfurimonas autotrophica]ADN08376.1 pantothenate synthetase [Sulfurimonas autotrophica DSM 16294]